LSSGGGSWIEDPAKAARCRTELNWRKKPYPGIRCTLDPLVVGHCE
jgi:hypothetical protein